MDLLNLDYLRSGFQFLKHNWDSNPKIYQSKYTKLERFYNKGLNNMVLKTPLTPTQKNPPMSLDIENSSKDYSDYLDDDIRDYLDIIADCESCKQLFYKRRAEKKELKKSI